MTSVSLILVGQSKMDITRAYSTKEFSAFLSKLCLLHIWKSYYTAYNDVILID